MRSARFLFLRAAAAVVLMVLFFTFALAAAAGLLCSAVALLMVIPHLSGGRVIVFALVLVAGLGIGGIVVLWSIFPRIDRFKPPGPELDPDEQAALFEEIHGIAARTHQEPPGHVYLVKDVNAFVTERGGWMGIGSRRVMGLGLGLLNVLTVSELRAVLAHEFGHFCGGDTKLGPWIYKTRGALVRTVMNLSRARQASAQIDWLPLVFLVIQKPFQWYAVLYMRITLAISRAQEYTADRLAVSSEGAQPLVEGLKKIHQAALVFGLYMDTEVAPLLRREKLPPLGEGFRLFLSGEALSKTLKEAIQTEMDEGKQDPYDSHPPLRERIAHALAAGGAQMADDPRPAVDLLARVPDLESSLAAGWVGEAKLSRVSWQESAAVFAPHWIQAVAESRGVLDALTPVSLPREIPALRRLAARALSGGAHLDDESICQWATQYFSDALSGLLLQQGFRPESRPGRPFRFTRGEVAIEPSVLTHRYLSGEISPAEWGALWEQASIANSEFQPGKE